VDVDEVVEEEDNNTNNSNNVEYTLDYTSEGPNDYITGGGGGGDEEGQYVSHHQFYQDDDDGAQTQYNLGDQVSEAGNELVSRPNLIVGPDGSVIVDEEDYSQDQLIVGPDGSVIVAGTITQSSIAYSPESTSKPRRKRQRSAGEGEERPYKCNHPGCEYTAKTSGSLYVHTKSHGEKLYVCPICNVGFKRKDTLKDHSSRHNIDKTFKCTHPDCPYAAKTRVGLYTHMKTHGEHKYVCSICGRAFPREFGLKRHLLTHEENKALLADVSKKHQCEICGKAYARLNVLKEHMLTHRENQIEGAHSSLQGCDIDMKGLQRMESGDSQGNLSGTTLTIQDLHQHHNIKDLRLSHVPHSFEASTSTILPSYNSAANSFDLSTSMSAPSYSVGSYESLSSNVAQSYTANSFDVPSTIPTSSYNINSFDASNSLVAPSYNPTAFNLPSSISTPPSCNASTFNSNNVSISLAMPSYNASAYNVSSSISAPSFNATSFDVSSSAPSYGLSSSIWDATLAVRISTNSSPMPPRSGPLTQHHDPSLSSTSSSSDMGQSLVEKLIAVMPKGTV